MIPAPPPSRAPLLIGLAIAVALGGLWFWWRVRHAPAPPARTTVVRMSPDDGKIVSAQRVAQIDVNAAEKAIVGKLAVALAGSAKPLSPAHATDVAALLALFRVPAPPAGATAAEIAEFVERRARATESVVTMTMAMFNAEEQHTLRKVLDAETAAAEKALRAAGQR